MAPSSPSRHRNTRSPRTPDNGGQDLTSRLQSSVQVHLRLPKADADALKKFAEERGQTLSAFIRLLLRRYRDTDQSKYTFSLAAGPKK